VTAASLLDLNGPAGALRLGLRLETVFDVGEWLGKRVLALGFDISIDEFGA
jgi:hypothetical protein